MRRLILWLGLGVFVGLLAIGAAAYFRPYTIRGSAIQKPTQAPDFVLSEGNQAFQLSDNKGKVVLLFFGYTSCPDICPTTLSELKQVHQRLGADAENLSVVFITVDPDRDTPDRTAKYARTFDESFHGLSGTQEQLGPVLKAYGVYAKLNKVNPTDTIYEVEHSTQLYLIDPAGNLSVTYAYGTPVDDILQDVRHMLKKG